MKIAGSITNCYCSTYNGTVVKYGVKKGSLFLADKAYDVKELYEFIVRELKSKAYIPINPRNTKNSTLKHLHQKLNQRLIDDGFLQLDQFILDSKLTLQNGSKTT